MRVGRCLCGEGIRLSVRGGVWGVKECLGMKKEVGEICGIEICGIPYLLHFHTPASHTSGHTSPHSHSSSIQHTFTHLDVCEEL